MPEAQVEIINKTKLDKMTVSKGLKKMVVDGLVRRTESKVDSRAKHVFLTKKGKSLIRKLIPIVENADQCFFNSIKERERVVLLKILGNLSV